MKKINEILKYKKDNSFFKHFKHILIFVMGALVGVVYSYWWFIFIIQK